MEGKWVFSRNRTNLTIAKPNFPQNTLVYVNNSSIMPRKGGHAMYLEFAILAQILLMANPSPSIDLDKRNCKDNEVLIFMSLYNTQNGSCIGYILSYITLRGNANENFHSYGSDKQN